MGAFTFQVENPLTPSGQSEGYAFSEAPITGFPAKSRVAQLAQLQEDIDARKQRQTPPKRGFGGLLSGEIEEATVFDPNTGRKVTVTAEEIPQERSPQVNDGPALAAVYKDFVKGLPAREADVMTTAELKAYNEENGIGSKIKGDRRTPNPFDMVELVEVNPYGKVTDRKGNPLVRRVDPTQAVDVDGDSASGQVSLGRRVQEVKERHKTPVIGRKALEAAYKEGRFKPAKDAKNPDQRQIGTIAITEIDRSSGRPVPVSVDYPVYKVTDDAGAPIQARTDVPKDLYDSEQSYDPIYRVGNPTAFDFDAIRNELAADIPGMGISGRPRPLEGGGRARTAITLDNLQSAIRSGRVNNPKMAEDAEGPDINAALLEQVLTGGEAPAKVNVQRADDGSQTSLLQLPDGRYAVMDAYRKDPVGPAAFAAQNAKVRRDAENISGQSFTALLNELGKGAYMETPRVSPAANRDLVDAISEGRLGRDGMPITVDNLVYESGSRAGQPMFPKGSHSRSIIEQELKTRRNNQRPREVVGENRPVMDFGDDRIEESRGVEEDDMRAALGSGYSIQKDELPEFMSDTPEARMREVLAKEVMQSLGTHYDDARIQADIQRQAYDMADRALEHGLADPSVLKQALASQMGGPVRVTRDPSLRAFGVQKTEPANIRTMQEVLDAEAQEGMADARPQTAVMNTPNISQLNAPAKPAPGEVPGAPDPRPANIHWRATQPDNTPEWMRDDVDSLMVDGEDYPDPFYDESDPAEQFLQSRLSRFRSQGS